MAAAYLAGSAAGAQAVQNAFPGRNGKIVFAGNRSSNGPSSEFGLYVINPGGTGLKRLTHGRDGYPVWSPDGKRVAFSRWRSNKKLELDVVNANGAGVRVVVPDAGDTAGHGGNHPSWSPDGKWLAFEETRGGDIQIYAAAADGSSLRQLTHGRAGSGEPDWSPDGSIIAFASDRSGQRVDVYVMDADGSDVRPLTRDGVLNAAPAWSPDGRAIVFWSHRASKEDIYVMSADGRRSRRVTRDPVAADGPTWSPDGKKIAFASKRSGNWQVYVMNADGTGQTQLTHGPGVFAVQPNWQRLPR